MDFAKNHWVAFNWARKRKATAFGSWRPGIHLGIHGAPAAVEMRHALLQGFINFRKFRG